MVGRPRLFSKI